jgi:soluble lytic murein transglycosylase-like protein
MSDPDNKDALTAHLICWSFTVAFVFYLSTVLIYAAPDQGAVEAFEPEHDAVQFAYLPMEERLPVAQKSTVSPSRNAPSLPAVVFKKEHVYYPIILQAANKHQVEPALIMAMIRAESGYNPRAVSKKGAKGLMQLMPRTAKAMGVEKPFDPKHNIDGGVKYFRTLLDRFEGDIKLALAAYNAGSRNVLLYKGVPPFGATKHYLKKVFEYYKKYKLQIEGAMGNA